MRLTDGKTYEGFFISLASDLHMSIGWFKVERFASEGVVPRICLYNCITKVII